MCVHMCENIENWATVARPLHVECLKSNVSGADCFYFLVTSFFSFANICVSKTPSAK